MATGSAMLKLSEIFESLQGEGVSAGVPTIFVRLAQCNLHCTWCDTKYTWDFEHYNYDDEVREQSSEDVARIVNASTTRHVVLTGGEPMLQQRALSALFLSLNPDIIVEVETNGTILSIFCNGTQPTPFAFAPSTLRQTTFVSSPESSAR